MHCMELVPEVCSYTSHIFSFIDHMDRCMVRNKDLDSDLIYHCQDHANLLAEDIDLGILWDEYGIVSDLIVSYSFIVHKKLLSLSF